MIVDDIEINRDILSEILEDDYNVVTCANGKEALEVIDEKSESIQVILLDLMMPDIDGFAVLDVLKEKKLLSKIPVLVITAEEDVKVEIRCFEYGIFDFIKKPFNAHIISKRTRNAIELFELNNSLESKVEDQAKEIIEKNERLTHLNDEIIELLGNVVEFRNNESGNHIKRVKGYTRIMANTLRKLHPEYELTSEDVDIMVSASSLHDVGKIKISDTILCKPGRLTDEERTEMNNHTIYGVEVMNMISKDIWDDKYSNVARYIIRHHHERYDGNGYPDKLSGNSIPVSAQIVSVADVYDALVSERVYKKAVKHEDAVEMIITGKCGIFSPLMLECFNACKEEMHKLAMEVD